MKINNYIHTNYMNTTIPKDIVIYISSFIFGICDKCKESKHFPDIISNYRIQVLKTVFDDDYGFEEYIIYKLICKNCIHSEPLYINRMF